MLAELFAIITLWAPSEPPPSAAAHVAEKLPAATSFTGIDPSSALERAPLPGVCTFGGGTLDGRTFAHAADLLRATSLPACDSNFDAAQRQAMIGTYVPSLATQTAWFAPAWFAPTAFVATPGRGNAFFTNPIRPQSGIGFTRIFSGITSFRGAVGGTIATSRANLPTPTALRHTAPERRR